MNYRPVILTDLFKGQPLGEIRTSEQARTALEAVSLQLRSETGSHYVRQQSTVRMDDTEPRPQRATFGGYLDYAKRYPDTDVLCSEQETPGEVRELFQVPPYCRAGGSDPEMETKLFVANRGNVATLHFDGDLRHVILYQVYGRKRVFLVHPREAVKLAPQSLFSSVLIQKLEAAGKRDFLESLDGYECILEPGEALYMPMGIFHHVEYLDDGMAVNFRFGRNRYHRLFLEFPLTFYLQNLAVQFLTEASVESVHRSEYLGLLVEFFRPFSDPMERATRVQQAVIAVCRRLCPELFETPPPSTLPENCLFRIPSQEMEESGRAWMETRWSTLLGNAFSEVPVSRSQRLTLDRLLRRAGRDVSWLEGVASDYYGKSPLAALSGRQAGNLADLLRWIPPGRLSLPADEPSLALETSQSY